MTREICRDDTYANARVDAGVAEALADHSQEPFWEQAQTNLLRWVRKSTATTTLVGPVQKRKYPQAQHRGPSHTKPADTGPAPAEPRTRRPSSTRHPAGSPAEGIRPSWMDRPPRSRPSSRRRSSSDRRCAPRPARRVPAPAERRRTAAASADAARASSRDASCPSGSECQATASPTSTPTRPDWAQHRCGCRSRAGNQRCAPEPHRATRRTRRNPPQHPHQGSEPPRGAPGRARRP